MKIYKYSLDITDEQVLQIPKSAKFCSLQVQNNVPCIWLMVDETEEDGLFKIITYGTGHKLGNLDNYAFLGTYQLFNGSLVYHIFGAFQ